MRTALVTRDGGWDEALELISHYDFVMDQENPEYVICYGGDGTLLIAESQYPGVPKILLKASEVCKKCSPLPNKEVLEAIMKKAYTTETLYNITATKDGKSLSALCEIAIRNTDPRRAIRFKFRVDGRSWSHELIGDGLLVSTPFGSTGYYRSITRSFFEVGMGIAFNNVTEPIDHLVVSDEAEVRVTITRGPARVLADTQEEEISLATGDELVIKKSVTQSSQIVIVSLDTDSQGS